MKYFWYYCSWMYYRIFSERHRFKPNLKELKGLSHGKSLKNVVEAKGEYDVHV